MISCHHHFNLFCSVFVRNGIAKQRIFLQHIVGGKIRIGFCNFLFRKIFIGCNFSDTMIQSIHHFIAVGISFSRPFERCPPDHLQQQGRGSLVLQFLLIPAQQFRLHPMKYPGFRQIFRFFRHPPKKQFKQIHTKAVNIFLGSQIHLLFFFKIHPAIRNHGRKFFKLFRTVFFIYIQKVFI